MYNELLYAYKLFIGGVFMLTKQIREKTIKAKNIEFHNIDRKEEQYKLLNLIREQLPFDPKADYITTPEFIQLEIEGNYENLKKVEIIRGMIADPQISTSRSDEGYCLMTISFTIGHKTALWTENFIHHRFILTAFYFQKSISYTEGWPVEIISIEGELLIINQIPEA